ncbi:alpha/beta fold hydrolase [uncultured Agrococcus sp.]|uniref:alpha/beta fold hydrolase n=1 Tax=uncultured Agrococcus sp. TaxID=382258 RepID=UPI0025FEA2C3|nr:alpha/beta fold hydrolase [uncultured Agrococcus sp.]
MRHVASADGTEIAVHELGDASGPAVLLLHGFASSTQRNWVDAGWDRALTEAGFRGIGMDLRGHGESVKPTGEDAYDVARFFEDVDAVIRSLDSEPDALLGCLGYSMGSRLAYRYAGAHPEVFSSLVLGGLPASDPFEGIDRDMAVEALAGRLEATGPTAFVVQLATIFPEANPQVLLDVVFGVSRAPFRPAEDPPAVPMLLMSGDKDDRADDTESIVSMAPDARFAPIPGRNHLNAITSRTFKGGAFDFFSAHLR